MGLQRIQFKVHIKQRQRSKKNFAFAQWYTGSCLQRAKRYKRSCSLLVGTLSNQTGYYKWYPVWLARCIVAATNESEALWGLREMRAQVWSPLSVAGHVRRGGQPQVLSAVPAERGPAHTVDGARCNVSINDSSCVFKKRWNSCQSKNWLSSLLSL